ncbi:hypothetical protein GCM10023184_38730 [Flaviaesturariibacter amylovorans]|uniref:TolC family protein n=2 Tax=Flaviaesturariibacter amylovorans TaxID=1084520 RepID=A0ABP8HL08_9BACT
MCIIKLFGAAMLLSIGALAQGPVLPLDSVLSRIERNNMQLHAFELRAQAFRYSADAATAQMAPMVGLGTFMTPYPGQMKMEPSDAGQLMLRIEQDITNPSKLNARKRYIESQAAIEQAGKAVTWNDLRAEARRQYYTWLVARQRISVLERNERIMVTMRKIEEVRYPYNQSQLGGIYKVDARIEENRNMIRMQQGEIARAHAYLNGLMNAPYDFQFTVDTTLSVTASSVAVDTAYLAAARGDIRRMDANIQSMRLDIESMNRQRRPDFKIQYDHMYPLDAMMPNQYSVMAMVSIPIAPWASKMYKSGVKGMQLNIQAMEQERKAMLIESQGMAYGMKAEIATMERRIRGLEETVIPQMQKALDAYYINYQENKIQLPVVLDAWEALNMLQTQALEEKLRLYQMIADYEKSLYR